MLVTSYFSLFSSLEYNPMMEPHNVLVCFCNYLITNQKKFSFSTSNNKIKEKKLNYNEDKTLISNTNFMINKANQSMLCLI